MNEQLMKAKLGNIAYKLGYIVWGEKSGGAMTTNLLKRKGYWDAIDALVASLKSGDPRQYMGGVLRKAADALNASVKIGDVMGRYCFDGGKYVDGKDVPDGFTIGTTTWDGNRWNKGTENGPPSKA